VKPAKIDIIGTENVTGSSLSDEKALLHFVAPLQNVQT